MNITLNQNDTTNASLKVVLQEADYAPKVDEKIKEYTKKAQVKGFRPGKVPAGLIRKMYGKSILADEINSLLSKSVNDYIKENNIRILGEPLPDESKQNTIDWENQKEFEFEFDLGILPDFELNLTGGDTLDAYQVEVDDETISQVYEHLQRQYGETANPETSESNDYLSGELRQLEGGFKTTTLLPINKIKKNQEQFIGVKTGDVVTFDLQEIFENDAAAISHVTGAKKAEATELKGSFEFAIEKINRTAAAELNQELFDKIFGKETVSTEEEFNTKIRETLTENYQQEADKALKNKLVEKLVKETTVTLPEEFFKKWLAITNKGKLTPEQIEENFEQYKDELKWSMIRNKVVEDNDIKVSNEEVIEATKAKMFSQFNMPEISDTLGDTMNGYIDNYLKQDNGRNYINEYEAILAEKVLDTLKDKVTVVEKSVTADEFRNLSF